MVELMELMARLGDTGPAAHRLVEALSALLEAVAQGTRKTTGA